MEPFLKLELFNEELNLDDIFERDEPYNLPLPSIVPRIVKPGSKASDSDVVLSLNEPALSESREQPAIEMDQTQDESTSTAQDALRVVPAAGASGQSPLSTLKSPASQNIAHLRSPIPVTTQDILRMPKRYKILEKTRKANPEKLKDTKYFEDHGKTAAQMSRRSREKKKRIDAERINLLRKNSEEIKLLKAKIEGYKELEMRYLQLERNYAMLNQTLIYLGGHIRQ
ncbi:unnamed protein product [Orchesella dallaii]|uniref:BZIP domain-containing protein n=1 Tax=Orchesella dallaii TaxID=48710 RepID=A0ABP1Q010_9HEXA